MITMALCLFGCTNSNDPRFKVKPSALGVMNEIVVITDEDLWTSIVGDTIRHFFEGYYPITPRPEPLFDLRQYSVSELNSQPLKKELRTYLVVANLDDDTSDITQFVIQDLGEQRIQRAKDDPEFNTSVGRDKWATGQILIYLFAHGPDGLAAAVERHYNGISSKVNAHDNIQLDQLTYARGKNLGLSSKLLGRYGAEIEFPGDFETALDAPDDFGLIWLRKDTKDGIINMVARQFDYTGPSFLEKEDVKDRFNLFGRYVTSDIENDFMTINDVDLPMLSFDREISSRYTKEWRGIWEMDKDFIGGPFITYNIVNENEGKVLSIDAFIFAPGKKKRDMMQQVDHIVKNIRW